LFVLSLTRFWINDAQSGSPESSISARLPVVFSPHGRRCLDMIRDKNGKTVCSISLLLIGNWPQVAPLTGQSPYIVGIGLWHALWGVTSALFIFIVCLLACFICLPALITIDCDRTVDRPVPSFLLNHHGSGVAVVGTTRLPIGCPST